MEKIYDNECIEVTTASPCGFISEYAVKIYMDSCIRFYNDSYGRWYWSYDFDADKINRIDKDDINDFLIYLYD